MGTVFAKTPKGKAEIACKTGNLSPKIRRLLIFVDGKRSVQELGDMLPSDDLQSTLKMLKKEGYIHVDSGGDDAGPVAASVAFSALPDAHDPVRLQQARNFMLNMLNAFVGALGTSSLIERIEQSQGHDQLRKHYDEWHHAIVMSHDGRREVDNLRSKLLRVI